MRVKTLRELGKLNFKLKRDDSVQITKAGSHVKARFRGRKNFVFGSTAEEAIKRLRSAQSKQWKIVPVPINRLEQTLLEALR